MIIISELVTVYVSDAAYVSVCKFTMSC